MLEKLKEDVCRENLRLAASGLVVLTWGNASAFDSASRLMVIKPSGVDYARLTVADMVVVNLDGKVVEGNLRPSSDTPTHLEIYKAFKGICGVVHTHSPEATAFAQAGRPIPCYGTTHADIFHGEVPCTRQLTAAEVAAAYEQNTGKAIVERFAGMNPMAQPGVLSVGHGPFVWGKNVAKAVDSAIALEAIAKMARLTEALSGLRPAKPLTPFIAEKHFQRKHGENAYYGQR